jgi:FkbM family methyltransferase
MRIAKRIAEVYSKGGMRGIAMQTGTKLAYWHRWATFRPHVIQKTLAGHTFTVAINNLFAQGWIEEHERWPELEWLKEHFIEKGDFVVDCGANMGFTTIFFAHFVGSSGRVLAFEPIPSNAEDARENVELNGLTNVEIRQQAVGNTNGIATLIDTPNGILTNKRNGKTIDVGVVRLDDVISSGQPTLLKIDVEGHELEVLKGASRILAGRPKLDIEVHPIYTCDRVAHCCSVFEVLRGFEYELYVQREIDGPIEALQFSERIVEDLAVRPVFHLFARTLRP